ncbi:multidrug efflux SMR transporter [Planosporangium thailandense]|uniref:Multidrug efflux SMR transporter n=1 Tax=Planosporangium thailandense TaxID=765197 RepID=A0ABX0Y4N5_9ACTN|nr:multidrug efflux SMR transporter [Planosporangium thailandense]NJC72993.1 multidrug efflux SMR transporter [Planosporangium thailandense]
MAWLMLAAAIATEVAATLGLRGTAGEFRLLPMLLVIVGYVASFTLMAFALRTLNVGVVYAIWAGAGTAGVTIAAALLYGERLNLTAVGGMALIVVGVVILAASGATRHG